MLISISILLSIFFLINGQVPDPFSDIRNFTWTVSIPEVQPIPGFTGYSPPKNVQKMKLEEQQFNIQYTTEDGETFGTPNQVKVFSSAIENGWWNEDFSCCADNEINRIFSPPIQWDGESLETRSFVVMIDDIEDGAAIEWLMVNIDPREHSIKLGASGECPWWRLVYPRYYGACQRRKLPASGYELPNREWRWRFRGFCPRNHQSHRYRIRVFAQQEWDQKYLKLNWPNYNADDVARQLISVGKNLGVATIIANGGRKRRCGGPYRSIPTTPISGIVADFDFSRKTLKSVINTHEINDIGMSCGGNSKMQGKFIGMNVRGQFKNVFYTKAGAGLGWDINSQLNNGSATEYSVVMDVRMEKTSCYTRLLNVNPPHDYGLYLCGNINIYPDARVGPYLRPNTWYHITITTRPDRLTEIFIDGRSVARWFVKQPVWDNALQLPPKLANQKNPKKDKPYPNIEIPDGLSKQKKDPPKNYLIFFNDCGYVCGCSGGAGEQANAMVNRIQIYNRPLTAAEVEQIFVRDTTNPAGLLL